MGQNSRNALTKGFWLSVSHKAAVHLRFSPQGWYLSSHSYGCWKIWDSKLIHRTVGPQVLDRYIWRHQTHGTWTSASSCTTWYPSSLRARVLRKKEYERGERDCVKLLFEVIVHYFFCILFRNKWADPAHTQGEEATHVSGITGSGEHWGGSEMLPTTISPTGLTSIWWLRTNVVPRIDKEIWSGSEKLSMTTQGGCELFPFPQGSRRDGE